MSRREMYRRTKGCAFYGVSLFVVCLVLSLVLAAIGAAEGLPRSGAVALLLLDCLAAAILFLFYRPYWLDLAGRETAVFTGKVSLGGYIIGAPLEMGFRKRELIEEGREEGGERPFLICLHPMEACCRSSQLIQDICRGPVSFRYLRRSRYIIEILDLTRPEPGLRSRHKQKKDRRRAQHMDPLARKDPRSS